MVVDDNTTATRTDPDSGTASDAMALVVFAPFTCSASRKSPPLLTYTDQPFRLSCARSSIVLKPLLGRLTSHATTPSAGCVNVVPCVTLPSTWSTGVQPPPPPTLTPRPID